MKNEIKRTKRTVVASSIFASLVIGVGIGQMAGGGVVTSGDETLPHTPSTTAPLEAPETVPSTPSPVNTPQFWAMIE